MVVDLQDLFVVWKQHQFDQAFNMCRETLRKNELKKKRPTDPAALLMRFQEYDAPSLQFLLDVFYLDLEKNENLTTSDWRQRPLSYDQILYSAIDAFGTL